MTTTTTTHSADQYMPSEVTTVPITQEYAADNGSISENTNDATANVDAGSSAVGATYGSVAYAPDLASAGVNMVLQPEIVKMGNPQGGLTSSSVTWATLLPLVVVAGGIGLVLYLRRRNQNPYYRSWY